MEGYQPNGPDVLKGRDTNPPKFNKLPITKLQKITKKNSHGIWTSNQALTDAGHSLHLERICFILAKT